MHLAFSKNIIYLLVLLILINGLLEYNKNTQTLHYLETKTEQYKQNYNVLYNEHKKFSKMIFKTIIDTDAVKGIFQKTTTNDDKEKSSAREELYSFLKDEYEGLKLFDVKQLHFHLPNNESFLRFHKPEKFGDDLTNVRATVKYVNKHKKPIHGFEEGRIYNGFRFVFPLFLEEKYLGSVEISMSTFSMNVALMKYHNIIGKFLILKSVVDTKVLEQEKSHYAQSQLKDFLFEKAIAKQIKKYNQKATKITVSEDVKKLVHERKESEKSFSMYDTGSDTIMSFLKIQNPVSKKVVGMFVFRSDPFYMKEYAFNTLLLQGIVSVLLILLYIFFQKKTGERIRLANLVDKKTKELQASKNKMSKYIDLIDKHIITSSTDLKGIITESSQAFSTISGYTKEELVGKPHNILRHPDMPKEAFEDLWTTIQNNQVWKGEVKNKKKDGGYYWVNATIEPNYDEYGTKVGYTSIRQDITDKKVIEQIAITDGLTNLYNRRHFNELFAKEINSSKRNNDLVSFFILDVDHFKQYNDTYGHQMGDDVLIRLADLLKSSFNRACDSCFRLGGEEFGVIFKAISKEKSQEHANVVRQRIEDLHIEHNGNSASAYVTVSIGLLCKSASEINSDTEAYKNADDLLYKAKESGRNKVCF